MSRKELLIGQDKQRKKKVIEKYIETHQKKGEKFWDDLINDEVRKIKRLYIKLVGSSKIVGSYEREIDKLRIRADKLEEWSEKMVIKEGTEGIKMTKKQKEKVKDYDARADKIEDRIGELEERAEELEIELDRFIEYVKQRAREITGEMIRTICMENPPDRIIDVLKNEIKRMELQYHQTREIKDLKKIVDSRAELIDIYIILKKAENIF